MILVDTLVISLCLFFSAFFSGVEIAFVSANPFFLAIEERKKGLHGRIVKLITKNPSQFITTMLVGNNIALVLYGIFMGEKILFLFYPELMTQEMTPNVLLTQTLISTVIILIFAEFLPKLFSQVYSESILKLLIFPAVFFYWLFIPITFFTQKFSDFVLVKLFKTKVDQVQLNFSKLELGSYIEQQLESHDKEKVDSEIEIFRNALEFSTTSAREVLIPRTELVAIDRKESLDTLRKMFAKSGKSKILVYENNIDKIEGYIHAFDMFQSIKSIEDNIREIDYVPETMPINQILKKINRNHRSIAVVIDEYGLTEGIITLEDIIEELFGDIQDEHDKEEKNTHQKIDDHQYEFDARLEVDFINQEYRLKLPKSDQYETLGGLIFNRHGDIPRKNEEIMIDDYKCIILDVSDKVIKRIKLLVAPMI
ncbi:MAG: hemolysin family protein [Flavobacteriaceae bacterium]|nr:hemolysin family protein [Flavobacteriaceae bacterium]